MGLDLIVEPASKPGHEGEWRGAVERTFANDQLSDAELARFAEITVPAYERIGAPRVGLDAAANEWIIEVRQATTPEAVATVLKDFDGYYVLRLAESDGLPKYSHAGLYEGVDETSFRGDFLKGCDSVLPKKLSEQAWEHKMPDAAVEYGRALLASVESVTLNGPRPAEPTKAGLLSRLGLGKKAQEAVPLEEQLDIVRTAGRWFVFWGERGHPIRAWS